MSFYVYILKCDDNSYYIGHTDNLEKRISEHKFRKYSGYTSSRLPIQIVFTQAFATRYEALMAERQMKKWTRVKKELLISGGWQALANRDKK
ncbi:TPA: GIY-YIG nuclease family protein [Candidatus Dependentiae bacterium]|nr:MAG: excinuclease ABC subunit C [candidate division TM6 bacterium GW2011_GWE2_31_21]KKP52534.1 MAG: excinuclease ABC subunit C [candidate division TM6 bacterium GW2011_GWF2_33_332]HBS48439.1 GIY-YIG nuclease family protein [Candidatus Dependentiae bacterium]HBZ73288.1 GIY-YIG nuclease family protein [Candidatus Dependentiae bacterium]